MPCAAADGHACAKQFVKTFGEKAFRRPTRSAEESDLFAVFQVAAKGGTFNDGVQAVIQAVLKSASFLHLPQLGAGSHRHLRGLRLPRGRIDENGASMHVPMHGAVVS